MRPRAYRPEAPSSLEDRSLLSGFAGPSADPVVYSQRQLNVIIHQVRFNFYQFSQIRDTARLRNQLLPVAGMIPFGRADRIDESIDTILSQMNQDLIARVPHAVQTACDDVLGVTRANLKVRIQAGELIMR